MIELHSVPLLRAYGLNRFIASARVQLDGTTPVLLDALGVKSVSVAGNLFTVTFMQQFNAAPIFFGAAENATDADYAFVTLDGYSATFTTATFKVAAAAGGAAPALVTTGANAHVLFFGERR